LRTSVRTPSPFPGRNHDLRLLTTEEVAQRFRTSPSTVRYWRHLGIGPAGIRVGRRVLYDEAECDRWWQSKVAAASRDAFSSSVGVGTRTGGH
jgi:predicted DNA-binding transcriptional regulator AlpA